MEKTIETRLPRRGKTPLDKLGTKLLAMTTPRLLCLIFFVALIIRVVYILTLNNSVDVWGDWWDDLGWKLASGQGFWVDNPYFPGGTPFYSWRAPGFPFFLSLIYRVCGHSFFAAKIGLAVVSALTAVLLYFIGALLAGRKVGLISAAVFALYPASIFWTGFLTPETLTAFLLLAMILCCLIGAERKNVHWLFWAGLVLGAGVLTRSAFILFLPVIGVWLFLIRAKFHPHPLPPPSRGRGGVRGIALSGFLSCTLGCAIVVAPWTIRNYRIHHRLVLTSTEGGIVFYIANNEKALAAPAGFYHAENINDFRELSETEIDARLYRMGFDFIKKHPGTYCRLVGDRFLRFWRLFPHTISGPGENYSLKHIVISLLTETPILLLGLYGMFGRRGLRHWKTYLLLYLIVLIYSGSHILLRTAIRYRFPLMDIFVLFAVIALFSERRSHDHV